MFRDIDSILVDNGIERLTQMIEELEFLRTVENSSTAFLSAVSSHLMIPGLRAFYPVSSADELGDVFDLSEQDRTLTNVGPTFGVYNDLLPFAEFDGINDQFTRANEPGIDITGELCIGGWFWVNSLGSEMGLMSKWVAAGDQRQYRLIKTAGDQFQFEVAASPGGAGDVFVVTSSFTVVASGWFQVIGRYTPSTTLDIIVNNFKDVNTSGIPASLSSEISQLEVGSTDGGSFLDGRSAMMFLAASNPSDVFIDTLYQNTMGLFV